MQNLRIIFAGTPSIAATQLKALIENQYKPIAVLTKPDSKANRGQRNQKSSVKIIAEQVNIEILQPGTLKNTEITEAIRKLNPDIIIVVAYGLIIPQKILNIPKLGCINMHVSLLPKWRGAAPIQRAIQAGDSETGITIMQMDAGMDTGDIMHTSKIPIDANDTSSTLFLKAEAVGAKTLITAIKKIQAQEIKAIKQDKSLATYANKINKEEAIIDWQKPAVDLEREVRAFNPWPISCFIYKNMAIKIKHATVEITEKKYKPGTILQNKKQLKIATTKNILVIEKIQLPNKKEQTIQEVINGHQDWFQINEVIA